MKLTSIALGLALVAGAGLSTPASAQSGPAQADQAPAKPAIKASRGALKAIVELQTAVNAHDVANIPAKVAAAQAVAKTPDDRYLIAANQYTAAVAAKDNAAKAAALEALIASGKAAQSDLPGLYAELSNAYTATNQADRATAALHRLIALDPNNDEAVIVLANTLNSQGRAAEAVAEVQKRIAAHKAAGTKPSEKLYQVAVQFSYDAKLPSALDIARDWVAAYPSPANWKNVFAVYQNLAKLDDTGLLDLFRLKRATGALSSESDFHKYAYLAAAKGFSAEAKATLEEGFAAGKIDRNKPLFKTTLASISAKAAADKASLAGAAAAGMAASTARAAVSNADLLAGVGDFANAAQIYRAALGKTGADSNLINLHLGAALAQQGDKTGATAALNTVTGSEAAVAKLWLAYLATRA